MLGKLKEMGVEGESLKAGGDYVKGQCCPDESYGKRTYPVADVMGVLLRAAEGEGVGSGGGGSLFGWVGDETPDGRRLGEGRSKPGELVK